MPRTLARQVTLARLIGHHRREGRARHPRKRGVHHHRRINHHQLRPVIPGQAQTAPRTPAAGTTGPQSSTVSPRLSGQPCRFLRHPSPNHLSPQIPRPVHSPRPCPIPRHLQTRRIHPRLHLPRRHRLIHRHVPLPARRVLPTGEVPPPRAATCRSQRRMAAAALRTVMRLPAPAPPLPRLHKLGTEYPSYKSKRPSSLPKSDRSQHALVPPPHGCPGVGKHLIPRES